MDPPLAPVHFVLGDKLPRVHEVVTAICSYSPRNYTYRGARESTKRSNAVAAYVNQLHSLWCQAFRKEFIQEVSPIKTEVRKHIKEYYNIVHTSKAKDLKSLSTRQRRNEWRKKETPQALFVILKKRVNPEMFEAEEKLFFDQQRGPLREGYVSDFVDEKYEKVKEAQKEKKQQEVEREIAEELGSYETEDLEDTDYSVDKTDDSNNNIGMISSNIPSEKW